MVEILNIWQHSISICDFLKQQFKNRKGIIHPDNVHLKIIYIYDIYWGKHNIHTENSKLEIIKINYFCSAKEIVKQIREKATG